MLTLLALPASAADLFVGPNGHPTIQEAIDAAADGDRVILEGIPYAEDLTLSARSLTLIGQSGTVLGTGGATSVITASGGQLALVGLTLDGGMAARPLDVSGGALSLELVTVQYGFATEDGGGLRALDTVLRLTDVDFIGNQSGASGGGAFVSGGALTASTVVWGDGSAAFDGGGLAAVDVVDLVLGDAVARANSAGGFGGGISIDGGTAVVHDSDLESNTAASSGGGLSLRNTVATVDSTWMLYNQANGGGGGLGVESAELVGRRMVAAFNTAIDDSMGGGGMLCRDSTCDVGESWFQSNAGYFGAGVAFWSSTGPSSLTGSLLCENQGTSANGDSGAVDLWNNTAELTNNLIVGNSNFRGGALTLLTGSYTITNNHFVGNTASLGGAVAHLDSDVVFTANLFSRNVDLDQDPLVADDDHVLYTESASTPELAFNAWYENSPADAVQIGPFDLVGVSPESGAENDPVAAICDAAAQALGAGSGLRDAGSPFLSDHDGSPHDIGAFGGPADPSPLFDEDADLTPNAFDCEPFDATAPGNPELCDNGVDDDCNGLIDAEDHAPANGLLLHADTDGDGFGDPWIARTICPTDGWVVDATDCDDQDPTAAGPATWYADLDLDGHGDPSSAFEACGTPPDATADATDCDDTRDEVHPGAVEICDLIDNDCNEQIDDDAVTVDWFADLDLDGFGAGTPIASCEPIPDRVLGGEDCDDTDDTINPLGVETCNGEDDDCDNATDEDVADAALAWPDVDGDTWGGGVGVPRCSPLATEVLRGGDCDDADASRLPGAVEVCDSVDQDCDGLADEGLGVVTWYTDADGDGYGDSTSAAIDCGVDPTRLAVGGDCDDTDASVNPSQPDLPGDGVDGDCQGGDASVDGDTDGDGSNDGYERWMGSDPEEPDSDEDGTLDGAEVGPDPATPWDTDGDGVFDVLDEDDDGDGVPSSLEGAEDTDGDGLSDRLDPDSDGDDVVDGAEIAGDPDGDGRIGRLDPGGAEVRPAPTAIRGFGCASIPSQGTGLLPGLLALLALARRRR